MSRLSCSVCLSILRRPPKLRAHNTLQCTVWRMRKKAARLAATARECDNRRIFCTALSILTDANVVMLQQRKSPIKIARNYDPSDIHVRFVRSRRIATTNKENNINN